MSEPDRLTQKLESGELALGVYIKGGPHLIPTLAQAGFDFVRPDLMFSAVDWREIHHMVVTAKASGIASWVRVPSNPWYGGVDNLQVTVDAARAFAIGAQVVQVSVASALQVEALLHVAKDWHRSAAGKYPASQEELRKHEAEIGTEAILVPSVESITAIDQIDEMLDLPGLRAIFIACTDFAAQLGHPFDYEHPEVWRAFDSIAEKAQRKGVVLVANTGYIYKTPEAIVGRVQSLYDHGARVVMLQGAEFLLGLYCQSLVRGVGESLAAS